MNDEMSFHCVQQFSAEVFESINGDDLVPSEALVVTVEPDHESLRLMAEVRKLAQSQGIRLRFVAHRS